MDRPALPEEIIRTGSLRVALPPDQALDLFTAEGEKAWAPGWDPRYVTPADGAPVVGGIWLTRDGEVDTIWRVERFDRATREAEYLRITPGNRFVVVQVRCDDDGTGQTLATVTYRAIALGEGGIIWCAGFTDTYYAAMMQEWERLIAAHLAEK
jgi:hypothetical protein